MKRLTITNAVLTVFLLLAAGLTVPRFFSFQSLCKRALECGSLNRTPQGPFRADFRFKREEICGDLATMANRPDLCSLRPEIFETDPWGYRNSPDAWTLNPEILVFGDSFAFGEGLTQEEGPAVEISKLTGRKVFDGGGKLELNYLRWQLEHFRQSPRDVLFFHLERHHHNASQLKEWSETVGDEYPPTQWAIYLDSLSRYNPLKILAIKLDKAFFTPGVFTNRFEREVPMYALKSGIPFLFLGSSIIQYEERSPQDLLDETAFFAAVNDKLKNKNIRLTVVLIPEKYAVYAPLLLNPPKPDLEGPGYLDKLSSALSKSGVRSVNLLPVFKEAAREGITNDRFIYWPDDTHWNSEGVKLMSKEVIKGL